MPTTYDSSILKSKLKKLNCKTLRRFLRSLTTIPYISRIRKDDLVVAILRELKKPSMKSFMTVEEDNSWSSYIRKPSVEDRIIRKLHQKVDTTEFLANKSYEVAPGFKPK